MIRLKKRISPKQRRTMMIARAPWVAAAWLIVGGTGCIVDNDSFYISQVQKPAARCVISTSSGSDFYSSGMLDVSMKQGYILHPLLVNNLPASVSRDNQPERNILQLLGIKVSIDLRDVPGSYPDALLNFSSLASGSLLPGATMYTSVQGVQDALAGFLAPVLPKNIQPQIVLKLRAVADHGGWKIESKQFLFPLTLCNGCLVDFRATCPADAKDTSVITNPCGLPQDEPVTCCKTNDQLTKCYTQQ
jgi:hypothetical protein